MALSMRSELKLTQQLVMTPQLQMAIKLLQLSRMELIETIREELNENAVLEEAYGDSAEKTLHEADQEIFDSITPEVKIEENLDKDIDWSNYIEEYNSATIADGRHNLEFEASGEAPQYEAFVAQGESLTQHLLWQFAMASDNEADKPVAEIVVGNLNADGYLDILVEEIAKEAQVSVEKVQQVVALIQTFDPSGICARNLRECLHIQAVNLGLGDTVVTDIIDKHLDLLQSRDYKPLARVLKKPLAEITAAVEVIKAFDPKPAHGFTVETAQYITPDIWVYKVDDDFVITMNDEGIPRLRINPVYMQAVKKGTKLDTETEGYVQEKMRAALWLIKSIEQRQKTIFRVMQSIVKLQREFFEQGVTHLKPLVLRDVAEDLGLHESTISRVTTNKYAYTPQGIFELKFFFSSSVKSSDGGQAMSSISVMERIRKIVADENKQKPLSDDAIAAILKNESIDIARRTVAKYREQMKILPSSKRKFY